MLSINPDAATRDDVARLATELMEARHELVHWSELLSFLLRRNMKKLCFTCGGKGSIPDPKYIGISINYSGPNGETVPYVRCQSCGGSGWVDSSDR